MFEEEIDEDLSHPHEAKLHETSLRCRRSIQFGAVGTEVECRKATGRDLDQCGEDRSIKRRYWTWQMRQTLDELWWLWRSS